MFAMGILGAWLLAGLVFLGLRRLHHDSGSKNSRLL
jgi:hypothetical protein